MKILCVDDDVGILKSLQRTLKMAGYETLTASSVLTGLEILATDSRISLVISDYQMPQLNGVAFLREIRRNWPETGRILLTGDADNPEVSLALVDGVIQRLIKKNRQDDELITLVGQMLGPPPPGGLFHLWG